MEELKFHKLMGNIQNIYDVGSLYKHYEIECKELNIISEKATVLSNKILNFVETHNREECNNKFDEFVLIMNEIDEEFKIFKKNNIDIINKILVDKDRVLDLLHNL